VRIGLVVPGFSANAGDWCIPALRHLARCLAERDDVRVIAIRYPYRRARYTIDGAETVALGGASRRGLGTLALWRSALRLLRAEHARRPFDVLHAFWATESGLLAAIAGRVLGVPSLISLAGGELVALRDIDYGDQRIAWERVKIAASLRLARGLSAGSRQMTALAQRQISGRQVHLAPLGVDLSLFNPGGTRRPITDGVSRIVHVGALTRVKDQANLLRAFSLVRRELPAARLDVCGDGPLAGELQRLSDSLGLDGSVSFRGELDHAQLPTAYRAASAFVLSSRHEAQSMVALEAAACGVPLVGTRVGVMPELTRSVVPVGDYVSLAQTLISTLPVEQTDPAEPVRARFGLKTCTDRFRELYASLIAR
jgi:glycosyltransferase involved in cell wall biosynthesis